MLRDASCLTSDDVGVADMVEQRGLAMVHVTHDGHDGGARHEVVFVVLLLGDGILHLGTHIFGFEAKFVRHDIDGLSVKALVDAHHNADAHTSPNDLIDTDVHHGCQFAYGDEFCELQYLALRTHLGPFLLQSFLHGLSLLFAILCTLLVLVLCGEPCKCFLHLPCHILFIDLKWALIVLAVFVLLALVLVLLLVGLVASLATLVAALVATLSGILAGSIDVHTLLAYAHALFLLTRTLSIGMLRLLLTLLALLLLRLALGTCALVDGVQVYLAYHIHLDGIVLLTLECENL